LNVVQEGACDGRGGGRGEPDGRKGMVWGGDRAEQDARVGKVETYILS
jgi:hypothetical protein